jgi:hypothetical protein
VVFGLVGGIAFVLGYTAGEAANRRGDARVLLLSLAFMATGGFMGLHAQNVLFSKEYAGFQVAIPVGLLVSAVLSTMAVWFAWTVAQLPPLGGAGSEAARDMLIAAIAIVGTVVYAVSAARYWIIFRHHSNLLTASVIACFLLLSEAMIGVAVTGERKWHASWWEWHGLIVAAYLVIGFAAQRQWRDERFRHLYLSTTRERNQHVSVLARAAGPVRRSCERASGLASHARRRQQRRGSGSRGRRRGPRRVSGARRPGQHGARLETLAPPGGVLIGAETYEQLPDGAVVRGTLRPAGQGQGAGRERVRAARPAVVVGARGNTPSGIRTRATGVKGRRPRPLDDGGL